MKEKTAEKYITIQHVSEILSCTDKHVVFLIQEGMLKAIRLGVRALRVSENSLNDFIASRTIHPEDYFAPKESPASEPKKITKIARSNWMDRT